MAVPRKDSSLVEYSANFNNRVSASPVTFGLTAGQAAAYTALHDPFVASYEAQRDAIASGTRSESLARAKDTAKTALLKMARELYSLVQANTSVSDANKALLGVHVRPAHSTPIPPPTVRPGLDVVSVSMRTVTVHIHDSASSPKRGKPAGVVGAKVYTFVGSEYPSDPTLWNYYGDVTTKPTCEIVFPDTVASGAQVWICAAWYGRRNGETGPVSVPISTNIQGGGSSSTAELKIAA